MEVIPGGCASVLQTLLTIPSQANFLSDQVTPPVFIFTVTKMLDNIVCAQKLEGELQTAKTLILHCDSSNAWV